ncbi:hypothetical protein EB001_03755, partial [bacterium]|nr:hypothetical protein [bacterium]
MITETGKNILAKYLIGQAPAYASYVALGCGPKPLGSNQTLGDYSGKTCLDFEMFRTAITSRGYVYEDGINKIVLTAELPTDERYEISEVGIYSAGANPSAGAYDSKTLYAFTVNENWEYHIGTSATVNGTIYGGNATLAKNLTLGGSLLGGSFGTGNLRFGTGSLAAINTVIASNNSAFGTNALKSNTSGNSNIGIGTVALELNSEGANNIGIGYGALKTNTIGSNNIAIG